MLEDYFAAYQKEISAPTQVLLFFSFIFFFNDSILFLPSRWQVEAIQFSAWYLYQLEWKMQSDKLEPSQRRHLFV